MNKSTLNASVAHLSGDWTIAGVEQQVKRLTDFQIGGECPDAAVVIDCSNINQIDLSGFQLLFVWLHCMQRRGLKAELINVPDWMRDAEGRLGVAQAFDDELQELRLAA